MLLNILLLISLFSCSFGKCPDNTEVFTGDARVNWKAEVNGDAKPEILAPSKEMVFIAQDKSKVDVKITLDPKVIQLEQITLETTKASQISAHGQSDVGNAGGPDFPVWKESTLNFNKLEVDNVRIRVESPTGEVAIRSIFIRGCVPVGWCPWKKFSDCSTTCGEGQQSRSRVCRCPNPDPNLFHCEGPSRDSQKCQLPCCKEQIDFVNRRGIKIKVVGRPHSRKIKGINLLLGSGSELKDNTLLSNIDGTDEVIISFSGGARDIIEVGVETFKSGKVYLKAKPGIWKASDVVHVNGEFKKSVFRAPGGQLNQQKQLTLQFDYPSGEIAVRGIYLIVCKK